MSHSTEENTVPYLDILRNAATCVELDASDPQRRLVALRCEQQQQRLCYEIPFCDCRDAGGGDGGFIHITSKLA
jgi:hypothetical protein